MKANEFRIGNLAKYKSQFLRIENLVKDEFWAIRRGDSTELIPLADIEPIPLTPEILEKCFVHENGMYKTEKLRGFFVRMQLDDGMYAEYNFGSYSICKVKYLHQLQNLYFALTGEELEASL